MTVYQQKLTEVIQHLQQGDTDLGYRRLIDCALDTQNIKVYNTCIALHQWIATNPTQETEIKEKSIAFLQTLQAIHIPTVTTNNLILQATDVLKKYNNGVFTLGPINISINSGNIIGLVGENGNGKTTLLRILANELQHSSGTISYNFCKTDTSTYNLRTQLVYIPQRTPTWYGYVQYNLMLTATHYGITGAYNEALVTMLIIRFGLWNYRNRKWNQLSSGYKMRFELVRTFLRKPKILFLDEPLANLDILAQQLILEDLKYMAKSLANPVGIILSSQVLYEVEKISDEVIFLKNGAQDSFNRLREVENNTATTLLEIESNTTKEALQQALQNLQVSITLNGGTYTLEAERVTANEILIALVHGGINLNYYRNITYSTRRLFK